METSFENYTATSRYYDRTRHAAGRELIAEAFRAGTAPLGEQTLLDAGCGTGNYLATLAQEAGQLFGVDVNRKMLAQARRKLHAAPNVRLALASVDALPYPTGCFDGVMINYVLHHLDKTRVRDDYPRAQSALIEAYRVLRPGGTLVTQTSTREQLFEACWWAPLIPAAVARAVRRYADDTRLREMLDASGFASVTTRVPLEAVCQGSAYLDPEGPLKQTWRDGDSTWALATDAELEAAQEKTRDLVARGVMASFQAVGEDRRKEIGQFTFYIARKE